MSVDNFIQVIWSAKIFKTLEVVHRYAALANRSFEGEIKGKGDTVKINQIGSVSISTYTKNSTSITPEVLDDAQVVMKIDQANYFAFEVDDVDQALGANGLIDQGTDKGVYGIRNTVDAYFAALYSYHGLTHPSYTSNSACADITSANVEEIFLECFETMSENNIPEENRFAVIPPWLTTKFQLAGIANLTENVALWKNGQVGRFGGFDLIQSNNVSKNSSSWDQTRVIMGVRNETFAYAEALMKLETYRPESSFSDAVKGLHVYGAKVVRPDMMLTLYCDKTAEP